MFTLLLRLPLRTKRDLLLARQRARQIAGLLGFDHREQAVLGAEVFVLTQGVWSGGRRMDLTFALQDNRFQVSVEPSRTRRSASDASEIAPPPAYWNAAGVERLLEALGVQPADDQTGLPKLERLVPRGAPAVGRADLPWLVDQLNRLTPLNVIEEVAQQNREFLQLCQEQQSQLRRRTPRSGRGRHVA